ncbi:DUF4157 domain-containing protein [Krasilnikovia sp. M28-CT-15]|uniref:eCIS core domain-containing protein n=1 Tax=Krasilnikovia sp. M28-CT-15 TaxID=3373540 RepID=UPI0038764573
MGVHDRDREPGGGPATGPTVPRGQSSPATFVGPALRAAAADPAHRVSAPMLLRLQGLGGNAAVGRLVQRSVSADAAPVDGSAVAQVASGSGQALPEGVRTDMEALLGHDFGHVRLHTGGLADQAARSVSATAFTTGSHVVFANGAFDPETTRGRKTLAHELTHVVQQQGDANAGLARDGLAVSDPTDPWERAATATADAAVAGEAASASARLVPSAGSHPAVFRQPADAGAPSATPNSKITTTENDVTIETHLVPTGKAARRRVLETMVAEKDRDEPRRWYDEVKLALDRQTPIAGVPDNQSDLDKARAAVKDLGAEVDQIEKDVDQLIEDFAAEGRTVMGEILTDSETRTKAEGIKYGLTAKQIDEWVGEPEGGGRWEVRTAYDMDRASPAGKGLAEAAKQLLARRDEIQPLKAKVTKLNLEWAMSDPRTGGMMSPKPAGLEEATADLRAEELKYDALVTQLTGMFPILGSVTRDKDDLGGLRRLAAGPSQDAAQLIGTEIADRMIKIGRVRAENRPGGDVNIYKVPKVVALTKARKNLPPQEWQEKVVDRHVADTKAVSDVLGIALGLVNLGLVLLAPATGGASLVVAAGLSTATAVLHAQEYMLEDAMAGSDLDKAKALSQTEPSLFWLAVDIVAAMADIVTGAGAAAKLLGGFRKLAPLVNGVRAAKTAEEAAGARKLLDEAAREVGEGSGEKLATRIAKSMESEGTAAKGVSAEIEAVEAAGRAAEAELQSGAQAATKTGHVHVTERGRLFSCSSPCTEMRAKHAETLAAEPELMKKLEAIEKAAADLGDKPAKAELQKLARVAASLDEEIVRAALMARAKKIAGWLPTLGDRYPILKAKPLDADAVARILEKGPVQNMKGQLLEELMAGDIERMLGTDAGREALVGATKAKEALEYIPGHLIKDSSGQFTDGMIIIRRGETVEVVAILEAKAGKESARELRAVRESVRDLGYKSLDELESLTPKTAGVTAETLENVKWQRRQAIEELREAHPDKIPSRMSSGEIDRLYKAEVDKELKRLPATEGGQVRNDIERLGEAERLGTQGGVQFRDPQTGAWTPVQVTGGSKSTKVTAVLPEDVSGAALTKQIVGQPGAAGASKGQQLTFGTVNASIPAKDLDSLATEIANHAHP